MTQLALCVMLVSEIGCNRDGLVICYVVIPPPDQQWGIKLPNDTWTGMMGQLDRQEVDMALGPFTMTPQRASVCDFSVPLHHENFAIITPRPKLQSDVLGFIKPFTVQVWLLILTSLLSVATAMGCVVWAEGKIFRHSEKNIVARAFLWVFCTVTQESSHWLPKKDGSRIIVSFWLLASLVFMSSYSGILTAMLTLPRVTVTIDSLADLVSQSALPWRLETGAAILTYLKESKEEVHQKAYRNMGPTIYALLRERQAVAEGKIAVICDETSMKKAMDLDFSTTGQCHLYIAQGKVMTNAMMSLAFRKNSKYLVQANHRVRILLESGLWHKWIGKQVANSSHCLRHPRLDRREGIQPLNLESFTGPVLILLTGATVSLLVFLCEHLSHLYVQPPKSTA
ncbi:glutamate receptor ionotropic, kainate glr-3-like [Panulirus ornatus]|uniref:glutamate receptor ionotropic, kainate glr-3-like n=1 Tax=Panulirus ornatus TaxID=150431 RepID=UPI003A8478D3